MSLMNYCQSCLLHFPGPIQIAYVCRTCRNAAHLHERATTAPPPLSAKGLEPKEGDFTTAVQDDGPPHPLMQRDRHGKWGFPTMEADPTTGTPNDGAANARLSAAIAAVLMRDDLTPEARTLVEGALRAQRGEVVDAGAETLNIITIRAEIDLLEKELSGLSTSPRERRRAETIYWRIKTLSADLEILLKRAEMERRG